jgi:DNA end-binding protein Ku
MPRAVWSGSIVFGLVNVPVRLFPATEPKDVRFHLTDARGRRVRYRRFVEDVEDVEDVEELGAWEPSASREAPGPPAADIGEAPEPSQTREPEPAEAGEREIAFEDVMRGYETDDGRLVLLDREDLEAVRPERSRSIEIEDFVALSDIDPVFFEKSYYLVPQRGAEKPYALLLRAIERSERVGIGRFVLRTKPHLVAIRPASGVLGLETLFFGDEVRDGRELVRGIDGIQVSERELKLAETLVATLESAWDPAAYADEYRAELLRRIAEKEPVDRPEAEDAFVPSTGSGARVEELMEALRASVEAAKAKTSETSPKPAASSKTKTPTKSKRRPARERSA